MTRMAQIDLKFQCSIRDIRVIRGSSSSKVRRQKCVPQQIVDNPVEKGGMDHISPHKVRPYSSLHRFRSVRCLLKNPQHSLCSIDGLSAGNLAAHAEAA